jgi:hypothetical protein
MAAATAVISAGVALAGVGLSVNQAVQADKERKRAQQSATAAANRMKNIKEENAFKDIEMPTLGFELAQQSADRALMSGIQSVQGAGAEAVIGALPGMMQVGSEQQLQLAAQANEAQMGLDLKKAEAQQMANARNTMAEREMELFKLEGAQGAAAQAQANMNAGISGAVQGLGTAVGYVGEAVPLYQKNRTTPQQNSPYQAPTIPKYRTAANQGIVTGPSQFANVPVSPDYGTQLLPPQPSSAYSAFMYPFQ